MWCSTNKPGGVGDGGDALGRQVEAAHLVHGAVAVLHRPDHPEPGVAVALEVEDHVHQVLEDAGPGDRAVLGHVADEHRGDVAGLGHADQGGRDLLDLGDATGHAVDARGADRLHGVDDHQARPHLLDVGEHGAEVGLRGQEQLVVHAAGAVGAQPHLGGRLLAGDVEGALPGAGGLGRDLEQQRALADAGLAGEQDRGPGHEATTQHPVELGHAARPGDRLGDRDLSDRHRGRGDRPRGGAQGRRTDLRDRAPGLALTTPADPLDRFPAALGAAVGGAGLAGSLRRHVRHARRGHRQGRVPAPHALERVRRAPLVWSTCPQRAPPSCGASADPVDEGAVIWGWTGPVRGGARGQGFGPAKPLRAAPATT